MEHDLKVDVDVNVDGDGYDDLTHHGKIHDDDNDAEDIDVDAYPDHSDDDLLQSNTSESNSEDEDKTEDQVYYVVGELSEYNFDRQLH